MKKAIFITAATVLALSAPAAWAAPGNNGGGNGGCGVGQQTNGCGGGNAAPGGNGGNGGNGYGGTGVGIGVGYGQGGAGGHGGTGLGGSVAGSGNSANTNNNTNTNQQGQAQGQAQGQMQGQAQSSHNANSNDNRSSAKNEGNNSSQSVTVQGDTYEAVRIPVATAYAAPLTASNGTCMGSTSVGGQGIGFGISIGSTWNDESCDMRYDAEALRQAGMQRAAIARLCQKAEIAQAMQAAGTPCPQAEPVAVASASTQRRTPTAEEKTTQYTGTDPIVRRRLGLPPLK